MKKWIKRWPYIVIIILITILVITFKSDKSEPVDLSEYTQQNIDKAFDVKSGMSYDEVLNIIGIPVKKEILGPNEEWHYCRTGEEVDEYIAVNFSDGKVSELKQYTVSYLDIIFHYTSSPSEGLIKASSMGDCKLTIKWGTYEKKQSNKIQSPLVEKH